VKRLAAKCPDRKKTWGAQRTGRKRPVTLFTYV